MSDSIEVYRYNRLTPLAVTDESLNGDFSYVMKGDCVVTFSRTGLFNLKRAIEVAVKTHCVLDYGRLPSDIRSERAALFSDLNSNYNVLTRWQRRRRDGPQPVSRFTFCAL